MPSKAAASPVAAPPISAEQIAGVLARIAVVSPTDIALAENPSVDALNTWLQARKRGTALDRVAKELTSETPSFAPDPLWVAWVQAAFPEFFRELLAVQTTAPPGGNAAGKDAPPKPSRSAAPRRKPSAAAKRK